MYKLIGIMTALVCGLALVSQTLAQPPQRQGANDNGKDQAKDYNKTSIVVKMMAFNKKKDGKLTKDEVTDERLHSLFDQADANKDGIVTKEELIALAAKLEAEGPQRGGPGGFGPDGPGGFGGPGGGPGGPGGRGRGGFGGPPEPGQVLPAFMQERLNLSADQKKQLDTLQKQVDTTLAKILTEEQKKQLKDMRGRGGRGRGGPGGPGGPPLDGRGPDRPPE